MTFYPTSNGVGEYARSGQRPFPPTPSLPCPHTPLPPSLSLTPLPPSSSLSLALHNLLVMELESMLDRAKGNIEETVLRTKSDRADKVGILNLYTSFLKYNTCLTISQILLKP